MRMRTLPEAIRAVQADDPGTAFTYWALRRMVLTGEIPTVQVGRKRLLDLAYDAVIERESARRDCTALLAAAALDDESRRVVELHICQGMTARQVAAVMHTTPGRVTVQKIKAIRALSQTPTARRLRLDYENRR